MRMIEPRHGIAWHFFNPDLERVGSVPNHSNLEPGPGVVAGDGCAAAGAGAGCLNYENDSRHIPERPYPKPA
jgi:hypothetical protein